MAIKDPNSLIKGGLDISVGKRRKKQKPEQPQIVVDQHNDRPEPLIKIPANNPEHSSSPIPFHHPLPPKPVLHHSFEAARQACAIIYLKPGEAHTEFYKTDGKYHCVIAIGNGKPDKPHLYLTDSVYETSTGEFIPLDERLHLLEEKIIHYEKAFILLEKEMKEFIQEVRDYLAEIQEFMDNIIPRIEYLEENAGKYEIHKSIRGNSVVYGLYNVLKGGGACGNEIVINSSTSITTVDWIDIDMDAVDPITLPYVEFIAKDDNSIISLLHLSSNQELQYSYDTNNWENFEVNTIIKLQNKEDNVFIRGILTDDNSISDYTQFSMTGKIAMYGNTNALWDYEDLEAPLRTACGYNLFADCNALVNTLALPSTELANYCYSNMYNGCENITKSPELPANILADNCYSHMFEGCANLINLTSLPTLTLTDNCYDSMFKDCVGIISAPTLPAIILSDSCYKNMFAGCINLSSAPELPATLLSNNCYSGMFNGCINLVATPELRASILTNNCYSEMFSGCVSLINAPELPSVNLANNCYNSMFMDCESLTLAPELLSTTLVNGCYQNMFKNCTSLSSAPELPANVLVENCYNEMFSGCTNLKYIKCDALDISATNCTNNWVNGVSETGTFTKLSSMLDWTIGVSGIPEAWNIQDEYVGLRFTSIGNSTIELHNEEENEPNIKYSLDGGSTWAQWDYSSISLSDDQSICFKGYNPEGISSIYLKYSQFIINGNIKASGNIMSLIDNGACNTTTIPNDYCFYKLFYNCDGLITTPELPATTLTESCYNSMFYGCSNLISAPELQATTLANYCYYNMFNGCNKLTTTPELPATTLANYCYYGMFKDCTNLLTISELPATTLYDSCYQNMFKDCANLMTAPDLLAETLVENCYNSMFTNCNRLNYIKCLALDISTTNCTFNWVYNVASSGTFVKAISDWKISSDGIPYGWDIQDVVA